MLTIRMQRTGRSGLANFRVVVQDSRFSPSSGRIVAQLGHYNPHTKEAVLDTQKAASYIQNGAQPTPRVVRLLQAEKVKLPDWVVVSAEDKKRSIRNPEKLRKNQPKEEKPAKEPEAVAETPAEEPQAPSEAEVSTEPDEIEEVETVTEQPAEEEKTEA